jgi:hypothetical protein
VTKVKKISRWNLYTILKLAPVAQGANNLYPSLSSFGQTGGRRGSEKRNGGRIRDQVITVGRNTLRQVYEVRNRRKVLKCPGVSRITKEIEVFKACGLLYQLRG